MKSNNDGMKRLMVLSSTLGVIGLILILLSDYLGTFLADIWLSDSEGGSTEVSNYLLVEENTNINIFSVTGGMLFGASLIMVLFAYYKILKTKE
ncbi:MAG: hypothetical protein WAM95_06655 [Bacillus sp. (in: firmicutes)]